MILKNQRGIHKCLGIHFSFSNYIAHTANFFLVINKFKIWIVHNATSPHTEPNIYIFTQPLDGICMSGAVVYLAFFICFTSIYWEKTDWKGGFFSERADAFVISPNRRTSFFSWPRILIFFCSKGLKSCQIRTWSCSECSKKAFEQLQVLIWHDLRHLEWKKFQNSSSGK